MINEGIATKETLAGRSAKLVWHPNVLEMVPSRKDRRRIVGFIEDRLQPDSTPSFNICAPNAFFWIACDCSIEAVTGLLLVMITPANTASGELDLDAFCRWFKDKHGHYPDFADERLQGQIRRWKQEREGTS